MYRRGSFLWIRILLLSNPPDYWRICDAQLQYHMVHGQIKQDLPKAAGAQEEDYLKILAVTWRMASEIQQMIIHIRHRKRNAESCRILERYIKDEPELSRLMNEYAHNLSGLYALVLKTCRE